MLLDVTTCTTYDITSIAFRLQLAFQLAFQVRALAFRGMVCFAPE